MIKKTVIESGIVGVIGKKLSMKDFSCPECKSRNKPRVFVGEDKLECKCLDCQCIFSI